MSRGVEESASTPSVLDLLTGLIDASLVARDGDSDANRFAMLETIRELALDRLAASGEAEAARDAHAAWCLDLAERAEPELSGPEQDHWGMLLEVELPNVRAAHAYLDETGDVERALRLGGALGWIWCSNSFFREGRARMTSLAALAVAGDHPVLLAKVLTAAGDIESWLGDQDRARGCYVRAATIYREQGEHDRLIGSMRALGNVAIFQNDLASAERLLAESRALAIQVGDEWEAAAATNLLGVVAYSRGDHALALARHVEAERRWLACGDTGHVGAARFSIAWVAVAAGDATRAAALFPALLDEAAAAGDEDAVLRCLEGAMLVASWRRDYPPAARLFGVAARERERIGTAHRPASQALLDRAAAKLRTALGEAPFGALIAEGQKLRIEDALVQAHTAFRAAVAVSRRRVAKSAKPFGLSKRELQVLPLLIDGQSDRDIAAALFIGRPTASKHVSAVMTKLGVSSRTAAAALAVREGLV